VFVWFHALLAHLNSGFQRKQMFLCFLNTSGWREKNGFLRILSDSSIVCIFHLYFTFLLNHFAFFSRFLKDLEKCDFFFFFKKIDPLGSWEHCVAIVPKIQYFTDA